MKIDINENKLSQTGVGLIEVLVSLLLIAIAILGFTAMQLTALQATEESMIRNRALTAMRGSSEMMRAYPPSYQNKFQAVLNDMLSKDEEAILSAYAKVKNNCINLKGGQPNFCSMSELAEKYAIRLALNTRQNELKINLIDCPAPTNSFNIKKCFITSWGETNPTISGSNNCINASGIYTLGANCFVMEAY